MAVNLKQTENILLLPPVMRSCDPDGLFICLYVSSPFMHSHGDHKGSRLLINRLRDQILAAALFGKGKGKASSLDIVPLTILDSGAIQPRKWRLIGNDCNWAGCLQYIHVPLSPAV